MSFGDRPSGTIATVVMSKTAELGANVYPQAAKIIKENSYTDDLIDSVETKTHAKELTEQIEKLLALGAFKIKGWTMSSDTNKGPIVYYVPTGGGGFRGGTIFNIT